MELEPNQVVVPYVVHFETVVTLGVSREADMLASLPAEAQQRLQEAMFISILDKHQLLEQVNEHGSWAILRVAEQVNG